MQRNCISILSLKNTKEMVLKPGALVRGLRFDASLSCDDRITVDRLLVGLVILM